MRAGRSMVFSLSPWGEGRGEGMVCGSLHHGERLIVSRAHPLTRRSKVGRWRAGAPAAPQGERRFNLSLAKGRGLLNYLETAA